MYRHIHVNTHVCECVCVYPRIAVAEGLINIKSNYMKTHAAYTGSEDTSLADRCEARGSLRVRNDANLEK